MKRDVSDVLGPSGHGSGVVCHFEFFGCGQNTIQARHLLSDPNARAAVLFATHPPAFGQVSFRC